MAATISGSGTSTLINLTTSGNTVLGDASTDTLNVGNGGLVKDASGNVGIGVTPSAWNSSYKAQEIGAVGNSLIGFGTSDFAISSGAYYSSSGWKYSATNSLGASFYEQYSGQHIWYTKAATSHTAGDAITFTQAMTLDSSGNLLVGTTSTVNAGVVSVAYSAATSIGLGIKQTNSGVGTLVNFYNSAGTSQGYIYNNNNGTVSYANGSDYRLKSDIAALSGGLTQVMQLKPCTYKYIGHEQTVSGFIAHELAEVCPQAVVGEKDAVDAEGNPVYQGIDTSFLVATLTAAIQEQQAIITQLQADVAALKGTA